MHPVELPREIIESFFPLRSVGREPLVDCTQWLGAHAIDALLCGDTRFDQARVAQDPEMLGHRRLAQAQGRDEFRDRSLLHAENVENAATVRLGDDIEGGI